eukprot:11830-Heterococcus_DN1.PRE.1
MEEEAAIPHGHITSLAVLRTHRKRGIATALMRASQLCMQEAFSADNVSLHVRKSNAGAFHLYTRTLGYEICKTEIGYYADGEDAYDMKLQFVQHGSAVTTTAKSKPAAAAAAVAAAPAAAAEPAADSSSSGAGSPRKRAATEDGAA